jgi:hypothetical protein
MNGRKPKAAEVERPACPDTGLSPVKQPREPGRDIFPARCQRCVGKGRIEWSRVAARDRQR